MYLAEFINMLPAAEAPAHTENREGFYHVSSVNGNESKATLHMIIRDHNKQSFAKRKEFITVLVEFSTANTEKTRFRLKLKTATTICLMSLKSI